jgi:predicted RND superfamily exporter protein
VNIQRPDSQIRPPEQPGQLAFGIERIGLLSLSFPATVTVLMIVLSIAAAFGVARLKVDDSLSQLFRSDTAEFQQYAALLRRFPSSEFDVLAVVEGDNLLERASLEKLREAVTDVQLIDGTRGVISLFSARHLPEKDETPPPLVPDTLPEGAAYDQLIERVKANEIIRGKLLSEDGKLALIVIALDQPLVESRGLADVIAEIRKALDEPLAEVGLKSTLSGVPVMQLEIRQAVERDRLLYNVIGFIAGCAMAALFFRRVSFILIATAPPLIAILWSLGLLGWLDFRLNMFLNVMTPLIMVMGFSDSMQMTFAARDRLLAGDDKIEALRYAIRVVGPAVAITDATAGMSFLALMFSDSYLIRTFGAAGAISCAVAFVAVVGLVPLLGVLLLRREQAFAAQMQGADAAVDLLRRICSLIVDHVVRRPAFYSILWVVVVGGLIVLYTNLDPRYRLADQVPSEKEAIEANQRLDVKLTGANPVHILIEFPPNTSLFTPATLRVIAEAHDVMEEQAGLGNVWSVETLRRWLARAGLTGIPTLQKYVRALPEHLVRRFISVKEDAVVVTGRIPDVQASEMLPVIEALEQKLAAVRARHPGYTISVTGLSAIAARNSASMIGQLNRGLTIEMIFVAALIGIAFRSPMVMLLSILPGLFPIVISGAVLWWLNEGLQFASVVALTVAFGLGLDATIHYLNRLRLEDNPNEPPEEGVKRATLRVGPALILTTLVLACGLVVTVFSDLPSLRLFGWLSAFTLLAALAGDLLILPATVMLARRLTAKRKRPSAPSGVSPS